MPSATDDSAPVVRAQTLTTGYRAEPAVEGVTFAVGCGELVGLIGPNGSGKSTLIKALVGLLPVWSGTVEVLGRSPEHARDRVGYMPQVEAIDWHFPISVREVVATGRYRPHWGPSRLRRLGHLRPGWDPAVEAALARLDIEGLAGRQIGELSGGEQRRVLMARTLVRDPDLLLLDEPAAGLDVPTEERLLDLFLELAREGKTLIVATHDVTSVRGTYSLALCMNRRLVAAGPPVDVMTEDVLRRTFGHHLVVLHHGEHGGPADDHVRHGAHAHEPEGG